MDVSVPVNVVVFVGIVTLASCGLAAVVPARRAARLDPAAALRWE
jgi:ABC-type antimicrobial peptide transport system permease subunit